MGKQTEEVKLRGEGMHRPMPEGGNTGEKTHDLREMDEQKLNEPELLTSVDDRLANLRDMTRPVRGQRSDPAADDDELEELDDVAKSDETTAGKVKPDASDSSTLDEGTKGGKEGQEYVLPEAYKRCAAAYGWKEGDVEEFFKRDPERALTTLSNIYQTRNRASAEFAAIGRKHAQERQQSAAEAKPAFKPVDTAKLKEQYGEEAGPLIEMIEAQNQTLQQLAERLPAAKPEKAKPFESAVEESGVEQQVYNFFEADRMKPYEKVYGKLGLGMTWDDLTPGQRQHRWRVLEQADLIAGGAKLQGVEMTLDEAMESAHLLVTQRYRDQILVDGIKEKVVKRSRGITLKPSGGRRKPGESPADSAMPGSRTKDQLVEDTQRKLSRMFGR